MPWLSLQRNLHASLTARNTTSSALEVRKEVSDIIPWMTVQTGSQTLLIEVMGDQTDASAQDEESVQDTHVQVVFGFFGAEGAAVAHEIHEADGDAAVDIEDEIIFFGRGHGFDGDSIVEHFAAGEALLDEIFDQLHAEIGIVARFDFVADTGNYSCQNT